MDNEQQKIINEMSRVITEAARNALIQLLKDPKIIAMLKLNGGGFLEGGFVGKSFEGEAGYVMQPGEFVINTDDPRHKDNVRLLNDIKNELDEDYNLLDEMDMPGGFR